MAMHPPIDDGPTSGDRPLVKAAAVARKGSARSPIMVVAAARNGLPRTSGDCGKRQCYARLWQRTVAAQATIAGM
ncbi:hypothetical protein BHE74_00011749 [Ensete ventricosum]|nr:hypothetical protein BHE74_00011749 [Ensete ventricosum]